LKCTYCVPDEAPSFIPKASVLSFEEITRLVREAAVPLGVNRLRITGGEPLQRRDLVQLIGMLRAVPGVEGIGLTTNAERLAPLADALADAGVDKINISLDTLNQDRFKKLTRVDALAKVLAGITAAGRANYKVRKLNCVPIRGVNDDEFPELLSFAADSGFELRFIEFMPFGSAWSPDQVVSDQEVLQRIQDVHGPASPLPIVLGDTATRYRLGDGTIFGIIPTSSKPFCGQCDRIRMTADGQLLACLFATQGEDMRALLRGGASAQELQIALVRSLRGKGIGYMEELHRGQREVEPERNMKRIGG